MIKIRILKNNYSSIKNKFVFKLDEEIKLNRYMIKLIEEAERDIEDGNEPISLEDWQAEMRENYDVDF